MATAVQTTTPAARARPASRRRRILRLAGEDDAGSETDTESESRSSRRSFYSAIESSPCADEAPWSHQPEQNLSPPASSPSQSYSDQYDCDTSPSTPSLVLSSRSASEESLLNAHMACLYSDRTASTPLASLEAPDKASEEDAEPRILSLPLKVCAYALALLPIPTDWLTGAAYAAALPPLPVERATNPKTCKPYRRACTDSR
jgi:hypothetical protein